MIYTIGHSNTDFPSFLAKLDAHNIDLLVDIRSHPGSRYVLWATKAALKEALKDRYTHLPELGGPTDGDYSDPLNFPKNRIGRARSDRDIFQKQILHGCNCDIKAENLEEIQHLLSRGESRLSIPPELSVSSLRHLRDRWPESIEGPHRSIDKALRNAVKLAGVVDDDKHDLPHAFVSESSVSTNTSEASSSFSEDVQRKNSYSHQSNTCQICQKPKIVRQWYNQGLYDFDLWMGSDPKFLDGLKKLDELAQNKKVAICCSEVLWWKCHRSMVADAIVAKGGSVKHIMNPKSAPSHPTGEALQDRLIRYDDITRKIWD